MDDRKNRFVERGKKGYLALQHFSRHYRWQLMAAVFVIFLIGFAYHTFAPSLPGQVTEDVLCQSGSNDNWRGWHLGNGWKQLNNLLLNDGTNGDYNGRPTLVAPARCQPKTTDYAVEATIQVVSTSRNSYSGFGLNVRGLPSPSTQTGYSTYIDSSSGANIAIAGGDAINTTSFNPGTSFHTYRAEVRGNTINFLIDGKSVLNVVDNRFISAGEVGLWCANMQIEMSSFKVVKL
ncbi:MAG TPA: hypothetical protein VFA09_06730 [Ktedonobacteraceae bacterium]|nr:hypothetical protein [Ktedonobacteraceae bacterium]